MEQKTRRRELINYWKTPGLNRGKKVFLSFRYQPLCSDLTQVTHGTRKLCTRN